MIDILALATSAVDAILPALSKFGDAAADKLAAGAAGTLLGWMRSKATERTSRALSDLEEEPESAGQRLLLAEKLAAQLKENPDLLAELQTLLAHQEGGGDHMTQTVSGAGAKGSQIKGSGNKVTF